MTRLRCHRKDDGVAAVELAIVLPIFLALTLASIDFALAFREQIMLRNAASNAASYAAVQPCDLTGTMATTGTIGITERATDELANVSVLKPFDIQVSTIFTDSTGTVLTAVDACSSAAEVEVAVTAPYKLITGDVLGLFGVPQELTVSGQETVQIQGRTV